MTAGSEFHTDGVQQRWNCGMQTLCEPEEPSQYWANAFFCMLQNMQQAYNWQYTTWARLLDADLGICNRFQRFTPRQTLQICYMC